MTKVFTIDGTIISCGEGICEAGVWDCAMQGH